MKYAKPIFKWVIAPLVLVFLLVQFVPVNRANPPVESEVPATSEVRAVLRRACYDCHSNETDWPVYSRVAPMSWLIAHDVQEGREHLNLSVWNRLTTEQQIEAVQEIWEQVEEGEMPLWFYVPLHPAARLSETDRSLLYAWSLSAADPGSVVH